MTTPRLSLEEIRRLQASPPAVVAGSPGYGGPPPPGYREPRYRPLNSYDLRAEYEAGNPAVIEYLRARRRYGYGAPSPGREFLETIGLGNVGRGLERTAVAIDDNVVRLPSDRSLGPPPGAGFPPLLPAFNSPNLNLPDLNPLPSSGRVIAILALVAAVILLLVILK